MIDHWPEIQPSNFELAQRAYETAKRLSEAERRLREVTYILTTIISFGAAFAAASLVDGAALWQYRFSFWGGAAFIATWLTVVCIGAYQFGGDSGAGD